MTGELLNTFRSDVSLPDDATAQRIYARATSRPRRLRRRRIALAIGAAAVFGAVLPIVFTTFVGGGADGTTTAGRNRIYRGQSVQFTGSDHTVTSISLKFWTRAANVTLRLQVFRSDSATVPPAQNEVDTKLVFEEHVPMTNLARVQRDGTRSTWDGTLSPAAWDGGCQDALYRVKTTLVLEDGSTSGDGYTPWFRCTGPNVVPHRPFPN